MTNAVFILGMVLGPILLLAVGWVYLKNQVVNWGGALLASFGFLLLGLSIWSSINVTVNENGVIIQLTERITKLSNQVTSLESTNQGLKTANVNLEAKVANLNENFEATKVKFSQFDNALQNIMAANKLITSTILEKDPKKVEKLKVDLTKTLIVPPDK